MNMPGLDRGAWIYLYFGIGLIWAGGFVSKAKDSEYDSSGTLRVPESCQPFIGAPPLVMPSCFLHSGVS